MEAFMYRYTDRVKKVKEILDSNIIGEIKYIHSTYRFFLNRVNTIKEVPELGGGSLYDVGSYPVNFIGMITNDIPVSCASQYVLNNGVDVIFSAVLKYKNGIIATLNCGFNAFKRTFSEVIGTKGVIEIPDTFAGNAGIINLITDEGAKEVQVEESDRYGLEVADFSNSILNNSKPMFSLDESLRNMIVIERLIETIKK